MVMKATVCMHVLHSAKVSYHVEPLSLSFLNFWWTLSNMPIYASLVWHILQTYVYPSQLLSHTLKQAQMLLRQNLPTISSTISYNISLLPSFQRNNMLENKTMFFFFPPPLVPEDSWEFSCFLINCSWKHRHVFESFELLLLNW
jgi:hypothetical protein